MEIVIKSLIEGARQADGLVVIVDVFRAFTTASVAFSRNAKKIYLVAKDKALLEMDSLSHKKQKKLHTQIPLMTPILLLEL